MPTSLTVRNLDEELVRGLKVRAARHGRSAEAEHREILRWALSEELVDFWDVVARLRAATAGWRHTPAADLVREGRGVR